jgi:glycosyltransferase involved in cell wall biosynthesis
VTTPNGPHLTVLFVIRNLATGGASHQLLQLVRHLDRQRFASVVVSVLGPKYHPADWNQDIAAALRLHANVETLERGPVIDPLALLRLVRIIRRVQPDIINTWVWTGSFYGRMGALLTGRLQRVIVSYRGLDYDFLKPGDSVRLAIDRWLNARTPQFTINTPDVIKDLERLHLPCTPVEIIPNIIDLNEFDVVSPALPPGLAEGTLPILVMVGRLNAQKDHDTLLRAAARLCEAGERFRLRLIGDGERRAEIEAQIASLGLEREVLLLGELPRATTLAAVAAADVAVLSTHHEGLPNAVIEAMALGKPVVVSDVQGVRDLIEDGESGTIVPPRDAPRLAEALAYLLRSPGRRQQMGAAAARAIHARIVDPRSIAQRYEHLYDRIARA